jgi:hypothetical protein
MAEDRQGGLWIETSKHVLRVDRESLSRGVFGNGDWREFGLADGLRGLEGVRRHRSVVADAAGRIWFSLNRGISVVDPARLTRDAAPAIAHVESILADGSPIGFGNSAHIPGGSRRVAFVLAGLNLTAPESVRFRYFLERVDREWSDLAEGQKAEYTNLSPGRYRLRSPPAIPKESGTATPPCSPSKSIRCSGRPCGSASHVCWSFSASYPRLTVPGCAASPGS